MISLSYIKELYEFHVRFIIAEGKYYKIIIA